ncbi:MAG: hypothetical protein CMB56_007000 [Methanobacteriota archaeon]|nr:MAG: hypothetical protein CMB56_007000 [Euryarchaeota archaeon]|tara:strand:- start:1509 stop:3896 length:2388 start_codon:yes stop_codon:yes gene_type:complete
MGVDKSAYRQPVTPEGLKAIEKKTLTWLDDDMYNNFNTGLLEQYLEEKNLEDSYEVSHWDTKKVAIGVLVGSVFAGVTAYIGLKIGLAVSAAWYVAYLLGMALKWSPSEVNIATSATTGATHASTGFIFTFPAIFLLAQTGNNAKYMVGDGTLITDPNIWQLAFIGIVASMFAGFLGVMYFIIFRRVWLVEDPLPMPGFEATMKLLDITCDISTGAQEKAKDSLVTVGVWTSITMLVLFLIEYPLIWYKETKTTVLDWIANSLSGEDWGVASFYSNGIIHQPSLISDGPYTKYHVDGNPVMNAFSHTYLGIYLSPSLFAIGWFMKFRTALLVSMGTLMAWFWLIPLAVMTDVTVYDPSKQASLQLSDYLSLGGGSAALQQIAFSKYVKIIAIGAILGGGLFGLFKMWRTFATIGADIKTAFRGGDVQEYTEGKGWYEWPLTHLPIFMCITFLSMIIVFTLGGFGIIPSLIFTIILLLTTFFLGAIAVRVMGETGIEPVSGTSFIVLLMLMGVFLTFGDSFGLSQQDAILLGLVGTTVFGSAISMSGTVVHDYKVSLYIGNRPYHISKGNIFGVVPGAILGAGVAIFLSMLLANGSINLEAPQANAFATFTILLAERQGDLGLLFLGVLLGAFIEWATGMGTSFGLGMYLPAYYTFPFLIGGYARDYWEKNKLQPKVDKIKVNEGSKIAERARALALLTTFMIAAGMLTGEAFFGTEGALMSFIDTFGASPAKYDDLGNLVEAESLAFVDKQFGDSWPFVRLGAFIALNAGLAYLIYTMFKRIGVFGNKKELISEA